MNIIDLNRKVEELNSNLSKIQHNSGRENITKLEQKLAQLELAMTRPNFGAENQELEVKQTLNNLIRGGHLPTLNLKSLSSNEESGGLTISPQLHKQIISLLTIASPMRKLANIETTSSNVLDFILQDAEFGAKWVKEEAEREDTENPKLRQKRINIHELYAQPTATRRLLEDSSIDLAKWITDQLADSFAIAENKAFLTGDGETQPQGILSDPTIKRINISKDNITPEVLLDLITALNDPYLARATFMMNRTTLSAIQKLKDSSGRFIWQPTISSDMPETLFGFPVVCCNDMPIIQAERENISAIILADFKAAYTIVDREQFSLMQDPYTSKPFIKFYAVKRVGGNVINPNAVKILQVNSKSTS